jgi:16S rRNA (guanine1516-N2)-methyltransferase
MSHINEVISSAIAVGYEDASLHDRAESLARQLQLPLNNKQFPRLSVTQDKLILLLPGFSPLSVELGSELILRRRQEGKAQGLIRACRPGPGVRLLDVTAGFGRDAAILAGFGADVVMIERHPVVCALLGDALERMREAFPKIKLSLICTNAIAYLHHLTPEEYPDVIYIDPMHPLRQKSALVKKEMQVLQQLVGPDQDAEALIQAAMGHARLRVVVKWPQRLAPLIPPKHSIQGKTVRFDVY